MKPTRKIILNAAFALFLLAAGSSAVLRQQPREITVGPVRAEAVNPDAEGRAAVPEAYLVRRRSLFGKGSLRESVTVDGVDYLSNDAWSGEDTTADTGWFSAGGTLSPRITPQWRTR